MLFPLATPLLLASLPCLNFTQTRTHLRGGADPTDASWCWNVVGAPTSLFSQQKKDECEAHYVDPARNGLSSSQIEAYTFDCTLGCTKCVYTLNKDNQWACSAAEEVLFQCASPPPAPPPEDITAWTRLTRMITERLIQPLQNLVAALTSHCI